MKCKCSGKYRVNDSFGYKNIIFRRRKCVDCGESVITIEYIIKPDGYDRELYSKALRERKMKHD